MMHHSRSIEPCLSRHEPALHGPFRFGGAKGVLDTGARKDLSRKDLMNEIHREDGGRCETKR